MKRFFIALAIALGFALLISLCLTIAAYAQACHLCDPGAYDTQYIAVVQYTGEHASQETHDTMSNDTEEHPTIIVNNPASKQEEPTTHKVEKPKQNHGNHYGNDKPDNNPNDTKNKHNGCNVNCTGQNQHKEKKNK